MIVASDVSRVATTGSFGYYCFDDVLAGETYVMGITSKRYQFAPRVVTVPDDLTEIDLEAFEEPHELEFVPLNSEF